jgi:hypothetical protein
MQTIAPKFRQLSGCEWSSESPGGVAASIGGEKCEKGHVLDFSTTNNDADVAVDSVLEATKAWLAWMRTWRYLNSKSRTEIPVEMFPTFRCDRVKTSPRGNHVLRDDYSLRDGYLEGGDVIESAPFPSLSAVEEQRKRS